MIACCEKLYFYDLFLNIILAFPLALLIYSLQTKRYILFLMVAILSGAILNHRFWLFDVELNREWLPMIPDLTMELLSVPIALTIILWLKRNRI